GAPGAGPAGRHASPYLTRARSPGSGSLVRALVGVLDDRVRRRRGGRALRRRGEALGRALVGVLDQRDGTSSRRAARGRTARRGGRRGGPGPGGVPRDKFLADRLQVGDLAGRRAGAARNRDGDTRQDVVGARGGQREDAAEAGGGRVAGGERR